MRNERNNMLFQEEISHTLKRVTMAAIAPPD